MGGYGALKWAFRKPHQFSAAASLSGVMDIEGLGERGEVQFLDYPLILASRLLLDLRMIFSGCLKIAGAMEK